MRLKAHDPRCKRISLDTHAHVHESGAHRRHFVAGLVLKMSAPSSSILWRRGGGEFSRAAADRVAALLTRKPEAVIALPTGQTPLGLYAELVARAAAKRLSAAQSRFFNLDDYFGLDADHPLSYARFLREHFLMPAGVPEEHIRLLRGDAVGIEAECRDYEAAITAAGGLDLAVLGLGTNGHIGFNEPGSDWSARTHVVRLSPETRATHAVQTQGMFAIPEYGITVGISTIVAAREILLLVAGDAKAPALAAFRRGTPDPKWPVTALLTHRNLTVLAEAQLRSAAPEGVMSPL
jgi:glucosamine-6-phosphate deaminase